MTPVNEGERGKTRGPLHAHRDVPRPEGVGVGVRGGGGGGAGVSKAIGVARGKWAREGAVCGTGKSFPRLARIVEGSRRAPS